MLEQIFLKVMDMSRSASMIIAAVLVVRIFLKKFPKFISYMLWSVVLFRLLCPVTLEFEISPVPALKPAFYEFVSEKDTVSIEGLSGGAAVLYASGETGNLSKPGQITSAQFSPEGNVKVAEISWQELFILFGKYVWISGIGIMFMYCVVSTARIRNKVSVSIPFKENIYITDDTVSPFVMGIFNPRIYLPGGLREKEQEYIILHEKFHIRRFDYIVKPVAFAALCIHWFNPLVWIAFILFCRDMEMSCDEAVINKMGENIRVDYSVSLLALSTKHRILRGIPVDFGEGDTKGRIKNLAAFRKRKKGVLAVLTAGVVILIICLASNRKTAIAETDNPEDEITSTSGAEDTEVEIIVADNSETEIPDQLNVSLDITEHYHTNVGDPSNLYYIDENKVLWGSGGNNCGQLGQGTRDYDFHEDMVEIAENVIHVDYSQRGFTIFLTEDHKLYGMGTASSGALQEYDDISLVMLWNPESYTVNTPKLLMENVVYAKCGRYDVVCLLEDGSVWTWGTVWWTGWENYYFLSEPQKILEDVVLVTGGMYNHAALQRDGSVWTWGHNYAGSCGVKGDIVVSDPVKVADNVVMVWTGTTRYNVDCMDISEFDGMYERGLENTIILKNDGALWACGVGIGEEEKLLKLYWSTSDYSVVCSSEFLQVTNEILY